MVQATKQNKKFELMLTRCAKAYNSSSSVVYLKIGVCTTKKRFCENQWTLK